MSALDDNADIKCQADDNLAELIDNAELDWLHAVKPEPWWPDDREVRAAADRHRFEQPYDDRADWHVQPTRTEQP